MYSSWWIICAFQLLKINTQLARKGIIWTSTRCSRAWTLNSQQAEQINRSSPHSPHLRYILCSRMSRPAKNKKISSPKHLLFTFWGNSYKYKNYVYSTIRLPLQSYFSQQRITFRRTLQILLDKHCKWEYDSFGQFFQTRELLFSNENYISPTRITRNIVKSR